jgi:uncharacterized protein (TIGR02266 family)
MSDDRGDEQASPREGEERRASARIPVEMWVEDLTDGGVVFRRAGNLSAGGLYLDQTIPLPMGTAVKLRFTLPGDAAPVTVSGQIVSILPKAGPGMGVKFTGLDAPTSERVRAYIDRAGTPVLGIPTTG